MLDTNTVSYIARNRSPQARRRFKEAERDAPVYVSAITEAEVRYGLAKRPEAHAVSETMQEILTKTPAVILDERLQGVLPLLQLNDAGRPAAPLPPPPALNPAAPPRGTVR